LVNVKYAYQICSEISFNFFSVKKIEET